MTRGSWPVCGPGRFRAPASSLVWQGKAFSARRRGRQRSGIPVSVDLAPRRGRLSARRTWMSSSRTNEHGDARADLYRMKDEYEKKVANGHHTRPLLYTMTFRPATRSNASRVSHPPCIISYTLHASLHSCRRPGQEGVYVT